MTDTCPNAANSYKFIGDKISPSVTVTGPTGNKFDVRFRKGVNATPDDVNDTQIGSTQTGKDPNVPIPLPGGYNVVALDNNKYFRAKVTYTCSGTPKSTSNIGCQLHTVTLGSITISPAAKTINIGDKFTPTVTCKDTSPTPVVRPCPILTEWISADATIASVNSSGLITGKKAGTVRVTYRTLSPLPAKSGYVDVTVTNISTNTIQITVPNNSGINWKKGASNTITWTTTGSIIGDYANVKIELTQGSTNKVVGTITASTPNDGSFVWKTSCARAIGTDYKIKITSTVILSYTTISANYFQISQTAFNSISLSPTNSPAIEINSTLQLTALCKDMNGCSVTCPTLTWTSNPKSVATVDSKGLVKGISEGAVNISASGGGKTSNIVTINVKKSVSGASVNTLLVAGLAIGFFFLISRKPKEERRR